MVLLCSVAMVLAALVGCEDDASSGAIEISPPSATLRKGQSAEFTASGGGSDYEWSLADEDLGTLSPRTGPTVTYTSTYAGAMVPAMQVLTAMSVVPATSRSLVSGAESLKEISGSVYITLLQVFPDSGSSETSETSETTNTEDSAETTNDVADVPPAT